MLKSLFLFLFLFATGLFAQDGQKAPDFSLENLEGETVALSDNTDSSVVLLSFWATWCKPCMEELPHIEKIYSELSGKGLKGYAISVDGERSVAKVEPFVKSKKMTIPVLLDTNGDVARLFYAKDVPHTVLIDKKGEVVYSHSGYKKGDEIQLKEKIIELLGSK